MSVVLVMYVWHETATDAFHLEMSEAPENDLYYEYARWSWFYVQVLSANPVNEELWERIVADPHAAFIGLRDAGIIKGKHLTLRRFERVQTRDNDVLNVWYFQYPEDLESLCDHT